MIAVKVRIVVLLIREGEWEGCTWWLKWSTWRAPSMADTILPLDPHGGSKDVHTVIDLAVSLCM